MLISSRVNLVRYDNGTLVKLTAASHSFTSTDYNPETRTGTYLPQSITINAKYEGNVTFGKWQYSAGDEWRDAVSGQDGITFTSDSLTIEAESRLIDENITIRCEGSDGIHYDTITITKEVSPRIVYDRTWTGIQQTNSKIALLATEEQLAQFSESETAVSKMTNMEVTANQFRTEVTANYATKTYAEEKASDAQTAAEGYADTAAGSAETAAKGYTDGKLQDYSTTAQMRSEISQSASDITTTVSATYQTKNQASEDLNTAKSYADGAAGAAESNAKGYTDGKLEDYSTTEQVESKISQSAGNITSTVAATYQTKTQASQDLNTAKSYADGAAGTAETNAKGYADTASYAAETNAKGYTDTKLRDYSTTSEMQSEISQTEREIKASVSETYATKVEVDSATNGTVIFQTPYSFRDRTVYLDARVYRNGENVTQEFDAKQFEWLLYTENDDEPQVIGTGLHTSVDLADVGYGGTVIGRFRTYDEEQPLEDADGNSLTNARNVALTTAEVKSTLEVSTPLYQFETIKQKFANIDITTEQIRSEVADVQENLHSEITQTANGITTEVSKKVGYQEIISSINQSAEEIAINAERINLNGAVTANNNVKINTNGSIEMIAGLIGLIHIISNALYSGSKNSYSSNNQGFYLGADGKINIGDDGTYLKWDGSKLHVQAETLKISGKPAATQEAVDGVQDAADDAATKATSFLSYDGTNGLVIAHDGSADGTQTLPYNVQLGFAGINLRRRSVKLAELTWKNLIFYRGDSQKAGMKLDSNALIFYKNDGTTEAARVNADGFVVSSGKIGNIMIVSNAVYSGNKSQYGDPRTGTTQPGFYLGADGKIDIGDGDAYIRWDGDDLNLKVASLLIAGKTAATSDDVGEVATAAGNALTAAQNAPQIAAQRQFGKCYTGGGTSAKTANIDGFTLYNGARVSIYFQNANTADSPTLNVNGTGAKSITASGWSLSSTSPYNWESGAVVDFVYDVSGWDMVGSTALSVAATAGATATNYLHFDPANGLSISNTESSDGSTALPFNVQILSDKINFRRRSKVLMKLEGDSITINRGQTEKPAMVLDGSELKFYRTNGKNLSMTLTDNALTFYKSGTSEGTNTSVAAIGTKGLDVKQGTIGDFTVSDDLNTGTSLSGGHLYRRSFYSHASADGYEYEYGLRGGSEARNIVFYVARIGSGGAWGSPAYITSLTMDGTFETTKANIGSWTVTDSTISANGVVLSARTASAGAQIGLGTISSNTKRLTAYIEAGGNISAKAGGFDVLGCCEGMPSDDDLSDGWQSFYASRSKIVMSRPIELTSNAPINTDVTIKGAATIRGVTTHGANVILNGTSGQDNGRVLVKASDGTMVLQPPSSKRYKDIDRKLTTHDIDDAYKVGAYRAKYKDGFLRENSDMNGKYMPMLIAEEVEEYIPEAALYNEDGLIEDWNYRVMIPVHQQMLIDQNNRIKELEAEVADLKDKLNKLMDLMEEKI